MADAQLLTEVRALVGREYGRVYAWDEINAPMIRQWCEIMGVHNRCGSGRQQCARRAGGAACHVAGVVHGRLSPEQLRTGFDHRKPV